MKLRRYFQPSCVALLAAGLGLLTAGSASAQTGSLAGLVTDASGRVVRRASVNLVGQSTGLQRATRSDERGAYSVAALPPGDYRVVVRVPGFRTEVRTGIRIEDGLDGRLDFQLRIPEVRKSITVVGDPVMRALEEAEPGTTLSGKTVADLPLSGRNLLALLELQPGVLTTPVRPEDQGQFIANGLRSSLNSVTVDGISANFNVSGGAQAWSGALPALSSIGSMHSIASADAIAELEIGTVGALGASTRTPGAQIAIHTQSGGNQYHGGASYSFRNSALDSNDWFRNRSGLDKAPLSTGQFGATFGGPVRRDRTFFQATFEDLRLSVPVTQTTAVPDLDALTARSPLVDRLLHAYKPPNGASLDGGLAWRTGTESQRSGVGTAGLRLDHTFAPGRNVFLRWQHAPSDESEESPYAYARAVRQFHQEQAVAGLLWSFNGSSQAELRFGRAWASMRYSGTLDPVTGAQPDLSAYAPSFASLAPQSYTVGFVGAGSIASGTQNFISQGQVHWTASFSTVHAKHIWQYGVEYRRTASGVAGAASSITALYPDVDSITSGRIYLLSIARHNPVRLAATQVSAFFNDRYAITPRITLHYGIRLEFEPPLRAGSGDPAFATARDTTSWSDLHLANGGAFWKARYPELAPRAGIAYRPSDKWVLRAGAGLYYGFAANSIAPGVENRPPYSASQLYLAVSRQDNESTIAPPPLTLSAPYTNVGGFDWSLRAPQVWQWTAAVDHALGRDTVFEGAWVGTRGHSLLRREIVVAPTPEFVSLDFATSHGESFYSGLQLQLRHRSTGPLFWTVGYTLSRALDNGSRDGEATLPESRRLDWGRSDFDARHMFNAAVTWAPSWLRKWNFDGIFRARSGLPITVNSGLGAQGSGAFVLLRPDWNYGTELWLSDPSVPGGRRLNPAAFLPTGGARQGTLGRNVANGFPLVQLDTSVSRSFRLSRIETELRLDVFNVMNHPNFANPNETILVSAPNFGRSFSLLNGGLTSDLFGLDVFGGPSHGLSPLLQIGGPRTFQVSVRFRL